MLSTEWIEKIEKDTGSVGARERLLLDRSVMEHLRNGRGFWPVITVNGVPQVVRFSTRSLVTEAERSRRWRASTSGDLTDTDRWTPETGQIDVVPLHALSVTDWPRVRMRP